MSRTLWVYMLHYDQPIGDTTRPRMWAQHYVGSFWAPQRIGHHRDGTSGVSIVSAFHAQGIPFRMVRIRPGDKKLERRLKQNGHFKNYCPECTSPPRQGLWAGDIPPRKKRKETREESSAMNETGPVLTQKQVDEAYAWADRMMGPDGIFRGPDDLEDAEDQDPQPGDPEREPEH